jgi:hypothetical protein
MYVGEGCLYKAVCLLYTKDCESKQHGASLIVYEAIAVMLWSGGSTDRGGSYCSVIDAAQLMWDCLFIRYMCSQSKGRKLVLGLTVNADMGI